MARCGTSSATLPRPADDAIRRSAGFSILELLVVLGLILVIGAIAVPYTTTWFERRAEREVLDRIGLLVRSARALSASRGIPVEIRTDDEGRVVFVARFSPEDAGLASNAESIPDVDPTLAILDDWARVELPTGLRVRPIPDSGSFAADVDPFLLDEPVMEVDEGWPPEDRLVLLLPDGSVVADGSWGLSGVEGFQVPSIDPWTGRVEFSVRRSEDPTPLEETVEDEDTIDGDAMEIDVEDGSDLEVEGVGP